MMGAPPHGREYGQRNLLSPDLGTTVIDIGGRWVLPVDIEPHGTVIYRGQ